MNSAPSAWTPRSLYNHIEEGPQWRAPNGRYEPARPFGFHGFGWRCKLAWAVFTGRADALFWPGQSAPKAY